MSRYSGGHQDEPESAAVRLQELDNTRTVNLANAASKMQGWSVKQNHLQLMIVIALYFYLCTAGTQVGQQVSRT